MSLPVTQKVTVGSYNCKPHQKVGKSRMSEDSQDSERPARSGGARPQNGSTPQQEYEAEWLQTMRQKFKPYETRAWKWLAARFGKIAKEEIISLGQVVAREMGVELAREYKRRKEMMIIWFEEHYDEVMPFIQSRVQVIGHANVEIKQADIDPSKI